MRSRLSLASRGLACALLAVSLASCGGEDFVAPEPTQRRAPEPRRSAPRAGSELVEAQIVETAPASFGAIDLDGATWAIASGLGTSSVELFALSSGAWGKEATLTLPHGEVELSLRDDRLLVGVTDSTFSSGEVHAFRRTASGWVSDPFPALSSIVFDIDQSGSRAAVGADGEVDLLAFDGSSWALEQVLTGGGNFGFSLGLSEDTLAVCDGISSQAVHVFERQAGLWSETATLSDGLSSGQCGDVALEGDVLVVASGGVVLTFTRSGGVWSAETPLSLVTQPGGISLRHGRLVLATALEVQVLHRGAGEWVLDQTLDGKPPLAQTAGWVVALLSDSFFRAYAEVGATCTGAVDCPLGLCVDGICCNNACDFSCAVCDVAGSLGVCTPIEGAPHAGHQPCPASACLDDHTLRAAGSCGGSLTSCDDGALVECAPYACSVDACMEACADSADCSSGNVCVEHACVVDSRSCADDHTVLLVDGTRVACAPYTCVDGRCIEACASTADCSDGGVCDSEGRCVDVTSQGEPPGCDCSTGVPHSSPPAWPLLLVVMATIARARRGRCAQ